MRKLRSDTEFFISPPKLNVMSEEDEGGKEQRARIVRRRRRERDGII